MSDNITVKQVVWSTNFSNLEYFGKFKKYDSYAFLNEGKEIEGIIVAIGREEGKGKSSTILQVVVDIRSTFLVKIQD